MKARSFSFLSLVAALCGLLPSAGRTAEIFVEAEAFAEHGGWSLDTQFIDIMGSPYLLAHGLGRPVKPASTGIAVPETGEYEVFVRTKDWVAPWNAPGAPGRFQLAVNGAALAVEFGTEGSDWAWQRGGKVRLEKGAAQLELRDLTGFDGRVDAVYLSTDGVAPPDGGPALAEARRKWLGLPDRPPVAGQYDLVVVGGGYAGTAAALSAARQGLKVALIQNRPVLGGNGSSEIRVWAQGGTMRGKYPHLGEIVEEFADRAADSPGLYEEYGDALKEETVRAEPRIDLFLNTHATAVELHPDHRIRAVSAFDVRTGEARLFEGAFFVDCTGHGSLGALAGAAFSMLEKGHLGMSNMWYFSEETAPSDFPETPWALPLGEGDFPMPRAKTRDGLTFYKGEWFWESGFDKHPIDDLELVRDWNLRAVFGAFGHIKNGPDQEKHANFALSWVAYVGGTRESRLLEGDVVLTQQDIVSGKEFPDGCVPTTWDLDLHYPREQYAKKFPDNPFISRAVFGKGVDRRNGYPVPYRCFYSKNIGNLFMAGRCISVDHEALGTVRVMRTCGMMGEVVGKAAYLCVKHQTSPRGVYEDHLSALIDLMSQPGAMRRADLAAELEPMTLVKKAVSFGPSTAGDGNAEHIAITKLEGVVVDEDKANFTGHWEKGEGLPGYVGDCYRYSTEGTARYELGVPASGDYEVRISWQPHENRSRAAKVTLSGIRGGDGDFTVNMAEAPKLEKGFGSLGVHTFDKERTAALTLTAEKGGGYVHADCVQLIPVNSAKR